MIAKILPKHALHGWIETLREHYRIIGPKPAQSQYVFGDIHSADDLDLSYPTSILPLRERHDRSALPNPSGEHYAGKP
jgi:hypothetical protein